MKMSLKAATVWMFVPYIFYWFLLPGIEWTFDRNISFAYLSHWSAHVYALVWGLATGGVGTGILWALTIRRFWLGMIVGAMIATGFVVLGAWVEVSFFGGFEENIDILLGAFEILLPTSWAGAYAGFLRFRDQKDSSMQSTEGTALTEAMASRRGYVLGGLTFFVSTTVIWIVFMGRLRRWW